MRWHRERRPPEPGRRAICHGDFHPQNILSEGGVVTGVLDWPNALVAHPAYDVASTRTNFLRCRKRCQEAVRAPGVSKLPAPQARQALRCRAFGCARALDPVVLAYYEASTAYGAFMIMRTG